MRDKIALFAATAGLAPSGDRRGSPGVVDRELDPEPPAHPAHHVPRSSGG
ncbi:hypothetical protein ACH4E7_10590 [Kitasatospora sp. NPDC018058]